MTIAARIHAAKDLRLEEETAAELGPHDVELRLGAGGICGSDMHYYRHARTGDFVVTSPLVLGHEIAGEVAEIAGASPRAGEDEELEAQLRAAAHAETIARATGEAIAALRDEGGATDALGTAERGLSAAAHHDDRLAELAGRASALAAETVELARDVATASETIDLDPASRAAAEDRLALLYDLRRKYGDGLEAVIAFGEEAAAELDRLEHQGEERERSKALEEERLAALGASCELLRAARLAAAGGLTKAVNAELPPLGLPAGAFDIDIDPVEPGPSGADRVTFTFAPNPGEPPRPLGRIASGGEASRLALALKVVLAAADETPLLVFDEVDAGVGGRNALALGERLKALSAFHQVLCVTHLPQVAAHADTHLVVDKRVSGQRTTTDVRALGVDERAAELAAMLGGPSAGEEARAAAVALLRAAR